jgi:sodium/bile acid cotransporter 7
MSFPTNGLKSRLLKFWFLLCLVTFIASGMTLGLVWPRTFTPLATLVDPRVSTAIITTLMSLTLNSEKIASALRSPWPVMLGFGINVVIVPLLGLLLFPLQTHLDLKYGLLVAASVPCTLAAASVWTRKAGGNDAISLLVTMTTSAACFITTPFWLSIPSLLSTGLPEVSGAAISVTKAGFSLSQETRMKLAADLIFGALIPTLLGQVLRRHPPTRIWADRRKSLLGGVAQSLILLIVLVSSIKAGGKLAEAGRAIDVAAIAVAFMSVIMIHLTAYFIGTTVSHKLGFRPEDQIAVGLAGSQKTLPTGLLIASELGQSAGMAFALFPMLMYHAAQLLIDTIFVEDYARKIASHPKSSSISDQGKR